MYFKNVVKTAQEQYGVANLGHSTEQNIVVVYFANPANSTRALSRTQESALNGTTCAKYLFGEEIQEVCLACPGAVHGLKGAQILFYVTRGCPLCSPQFWYNPLYKERYYKR